MPLSRKATTRIHGFALATRERSAWFPRQHAALIPHSAAKRSQPCLQQRWAYLPNRSPEAGSERTIWITVPANRRRIGNLAERRRKRFRDHLLRTVSAAAELLAVAGETIRATAPVADERLPVLDEVCATCRGQCCIGGGDHAYLDVTTLVRFLRAHPEARPRDAFRSFYERIPTRVFHDSCIFHSPTGCSLPRSMRAATCLDFACDGLQLARTSTTSQASELLIAAVDQGRIIRWRRTTTAAPSSINRSSPATA